MDDGQPNIHLVNWKEASKVLTETHQQFLGIKHLFINIFHCQGPLPRTFSDTWQLVWEQRVLVIVMTTRTVERHRTKCGQYWPELEGGWQFPGMKYWLNSCFSGTSLLCGLYNVETENIENYEDFIVTDLKVTHTGTGEERWVLLSVSGTWFNIHSVIRFITRFNS